MRRSGDVRINTPSKISSGSRLFVERIAKIPILVRFTILSYIFFFVFAALIIPFICKPDMAMDCVEGFSQREQFLVLYHLNELRNRVATGIQKTNDEKKPLLPAAVAMYKLRWSCFLAEEAKIRGSKSEKFHELEPAYNAYEYIEASAAPLEELVQNLINDAQSKFVNLEDLSLNEKQLLIDKFTHVGCVLIKKQNVQKFICILGSMIEDERERIVKKPYEEGKPGSKCPIKSLEPDMYMCIYKQSRKTPLQMSTSTQESS